MLLLASILKALAEIAGLSLVGQGIKLIALNRRGVLARIAAEIADAESNIDNVSMDTQDGSQYSTVHFTLQVYDRLHLAQVMRALRRIPEVVRITRAKGSG